MSFYKPEDAHYVLEMFKKTKIVYASMEVGVCADVHTYSGGLGILAGDALLSAADLGLPVTGLTLLHKKGYFTQRIEDGKQVEDEEPWDVDAYTTPIPEGKAHITLEGRKVTVEPRLGIIVGEKKHIIPILFLTTDLEENDEQDRTITDTLYGGNHITRAKQEAVLGIGGKRVLRALNCTRTHTFHMNEGHAAFAPLEDVHYHARYNNANRPKIHELIKSAHVFTTHTPVPAGHDRFSYELLRKLFSKEDFAWESIELAGHEECNMTRLALNTSRYANAVAQKHGESMRTMFPGYAIDAITNGVHLPTWTCKRIQEILDKTLPSWRLEPGILEHCYRIVDPEAIAQAHQETKRELLEYIKQTTGRELDENTLTVGFARRFASYKRAELLFTDLARLKEIAKEKIQFVYAGEAHPNDEEGKQALERVIRYAQELEGEVDIVFIPNYDLNIAKKLVAGCDLWLNNPTPPMEASGTSGMKASANAVPNLSTLDGWWIEGITKSPVAGWIIDHRMDGKDEISLYNQLEHITHIYYDKPERWREHMLHALSLAHYFNTHRMVQEYEKRAWTNKIY